jgi:hypothetical protein
LAIGNRLRGLLAEFGIVVAKSDLALRRELADLDACAELPAEFKELLRDLAAHWSQLRERLDACSARIDAHARERTSGVGGYGRSPASARSPPMRPWPPWATPASSSRGGRWQRGWVWCRRNTPAVAMRDWAPSAVGACLPAHAADPGRAQQPAASQGGGDRKGHTRATVDSIAGRPHALRQGHRGDCQQACAADLGDAGARRGLRPARLSEPSDAPPKPGGPRSLGIEFRFIVSATR